jgi:hypothetical protein
VVRTILASIPVFSGREPGNMACSACMTSATAASQQDHRRVTALPTRHRRRRADHTRPRACSAVVASAPDCPALLGDRQAEAERDGAADRGDERLAYRSPKLPARSGSREGRYVTRSRRGRLGSVKIGRWRISTRGQIETFLQALSETP